jgi:dihydroorotate dehydrogenase
MNEVIDGMINAMNILNAKHERASFNIEKDSKKYWVDIAVFAEKDSDCEDE